jgi:hypothetical protein
MPWSEPENNGTKPFISLDTKDSCFPFKGKDGIGMGVLISMLEIAISP